MGNPKPATLAQVQRELEEERRAAAEEAARAQEAIQAKLAELQAIEAARRQEVGQRSLALACNLLTETW